MDNELPFILALMHSSVFLLLLFFHRTKSLQAIQEHFRGLKELKGQVFWQFKQSKSLQLL